MTENIERSDIRVINDNELTHDEMDLVTGGIYRNFDNPFVRTVMLVSRFVGAGGTVGVF